MLSTDFSYVQNIYLIDNKEEISNTITNSIYKSFSKYPVKIKVIDQLPNNNILLSNIQTELVFPIKFSYIDFEHNLFECKVYYKDFKNFDDLTLTRVMFKAELFDILNILPLETFKAILNYFGKMLNINEEKYYHTINHVQRLLTELSKQTNLTEYEYKLLYCAIIFHDVKYKAGIDNETNALRIAEKYLLHTRFIESDDFNKIAQLIDSTRIGTPINIIKNIPLGDLLHDFDYIGFSDDNYLENTEKIYNECYHIVKNRQEFNIKRKEFLLNLIKSLPNNKLYISKNYQVYNYIAFKHITEELKELSKYE